MAKAAPVTLRAGNGVVPGSGADREVFAGDRTQAASPVAIVGQPPEMAQGVAVVEAVSTATATAVTATAASGEADCAPEWLW